MTGRFGVYGGRYVPETLIPALEALAATYDRLAADTAFWAEFEGLLAEYVGRPTPLSEAPRLSDAVRARVLLKREDLNHTGAHKINNALGQALLARRMGKTAHHRRDGRRPARRRDGDGVRPVRPGVRGLHGRGGHAPGRR